MEGNSTDYIYMEGNSTDYIYMEGNSTDYIHSTDYIYIWKGIVQTIYIYGREWSKSELCWRIK